MRALALLVLITGCHKLFGLETVEIDSDKPDAGDGDGGNGDGNVGDGSMGDAPVDSPLDLIWHMESSDHVCVGQTEEINVRLNYYPGQTIIVSAAATPASKLTASPTTLTFTSSNWNVIQVVTLTGVATWSTSTVLLSVPNYRAVEILMPVRTNGCL